MKQSLLLLLITFASFSIHAQDKSKSAVTTYYLIRHSEKDQSDKTNKNPNLTEVGKQRAENWSKIFENINFDAVYSTKYNRTTQTAMPTAKAQNLEIQFYDPRNFKLEDFVASNQGKSILIVGHSNTTPMFANALLGEQHYEYLKEDDFGSLFIITIMGDQKNVQLLHIN